MFELETGLIFWNTVSFAILVFLMYKWVLPPIVAAIKERQKMIDDSISAAELSRKRSEELLADYKKKIAEADRTAGKLMENARAEGDRIKRDLIETAEKQAGLVAEQAKQDLLSEKSRMISEAKRELADLVALAAGKVIGRVITKEDNQKMIEAALK